MLDDAITKAGAVSLKTTYATAEYTWLKDSSYARAVAGNIDAAKDPHVQSVYYLVKDKSGPRYVRSDGTAIALKVDRANQYLLASFLGGNAPDVVEVPLPPRTAVPGAGLFPGARERGSPRPPGTTTPFVVPENDGALWWNGDVVVHAARIAGERPGSLAGTVADQWSATTGKPAQTGAATTRMRRSALRLSRRTPLTVIRARAQSPPAVGLQCSGH